MATVATEVLTSVACKIMVLTTKRQQSTGNLIAMIENLIKNLRGDVL